MRLFICEKPSQARDIAPHVGAHQRQNGFFSGNGVLVTWCIGHLLEQAKPEHYEPALKQWNISLLPVLPEKWQMDVKASTRDQYRAVAGVLRDATEVIIATDADREGEVIAREILELNRYTGPVKRLWLSAMDDASIKKALGKLRPSSETLPMYYSGMGRSRADWLIGMNITMALTTAYSTERGRAGVHHCGRVQSVVLGLVVRRERAIETFKPKTHHVLEAAFEMQGVLVPMNLVMDPAKLDAQGHCLDKAYVSAVAAKVSGKVGRLTKVTKTPEREVAPLLYSLGSLQRDASAKYGLKAQAVLDAAQALYEKHKATTYPRTDCEYLPVSQFADVTGVVSAICKADNDLEAIAKQADFTKQGRVFNDSKLTGHHAIIPTGNPAVRVGAMSATEFVVYDLIRRRYLAQFLGDYEYLKTVVEVRCEGETFTQSGKTPTFKGWKRAYEGLQAPEKEKPSAKAKTATPAAVVIPSVQVGDQAINRKAAAVVAKTKPPQRYTEGTLLAAMESIDKEIDDPRLKKIMQTKEKAGIGTDATRSATIEGLFKREYIANSKKFIMPTVRGTHLIELIERIAPQLVDPVLTAIWEEQLMQIEAGTLKLEQFEGDLAKWLAKLVADIRANANVRAQATPAQHSAPAPNANQAPMRQAAAGHQPGSGQAHACPVCAKPMRSRNGPTGAFWGCSGYPECKTTLPDVDGKPGERQARPAAPAPMKQNTAPVAGQVEQGAVLKCRACDRPMRLRQAANGPFYGCSGYPECRNTVSLK